jgi:hypothetical protein
MVGHVRLCSAPVHVDAYPWSCAAEKNIYESKRMTLATENDSWAIAECHTGEYPYHVRLRKVPSDFPRSNFPTRLNLFWSLSDTDANGYASKPELDKLHVFEDRLVEAVEFDQFSILTLVLTGRGEREFVFYTPDPHEFVRRLSQMPQEEERYPIEIHANEDADWEYFETELNSVHGA